MLIHLKQNLNDPNNLFSPLLILQISNLGSSCQWLPTYSKIVTIFNYKAFIVLGFWLFDMLA